MPELLAGLAAAVHAAGVIWTDAGMDAFSRAYAAAWSAGSDAAEALKVAVAAAWEAEGRRG